MKDISEVEAKALRAIKISILACAISLFLGLLALWVLLNQVTVSAGIDKKLIQIESRLNKLDPDFMPDSGDSQTRE